MGYSSGPSLFGRNWLESVRLDWHETHSVVRSSLQEVLDRHQPVFQPGLGKMRGFEAKLYVDPMAKPRYYRPRSVPYALTSKIEEELDRLVEEGTLESVETADWAAPIVPVLKSDKKNLRICGDFRLTVNPVAKLDNYPIPIVEDLLQSSREARASPNWTSNKPTNSFLLRRVPRTLCSSTPTRGYSVIPVYPSVWPLHLGFSNGRWRNC